MLRVVPAGTDLVAAVLEELRPQGPDYRRNLVLFPGRRPAHFLRKRLSTRHEGALLPPAIYAVQDWIEATVHAQLGVSGRKAEALEACSVLFEVHRSLPASERLGAEAYMSLERFLPVGLRLLEELEALYLADYSPQRLRAQLADAGWERGGQLVAYFGRFYEALEQAGLWTRARYVRTLADRFEVLALEQFDRILVAGLYAFAPAEARLFRALLERPESIGLFVEGPGLAAQLRRLGLSESHIERLEPEVARKPVFVFTRAPDRLGQVLALAEALRAERERLGRPLQEDAVVVLPAADALFPVLFWGLAPLRAGEPYNVSLGYPLVRTPGFGFLRALLSALDTELDGTLQASAYRAFIMHPYTKNLRYGDRPPELTRVLLHALEEELARTELRLRLRPEELEERTGWFEELARTLQPLFPDITAEQLRQHLRWLHTHTLRALWAPENVGAFARQAAQVLRLVAERSTAREHPYFAPFLEGLLAALEALERSGLARERLSRPGAYLQVLTHYLQTQTLPFEGTPVEGLQVLGLLETRLLRFRSVYLLDANESILPPAPEPAVLLPEGVRRRLGLETQRDREELARYYFEALVRAAERVHLFYTEDPRTGKGERSRFLERLLWECEKEEGACPPEHVVRYPLSLQNPRPEAIEKGPELAAWLRRRTYSPRLLDTYLRCPIRFYYECVLGLKEPDSAAEEPDAREIGTAVHEILRRFFEPHLGVVLSPELLARQAGGRLRRLVRTYFRERYGPHPVASVRLVRRQVERQLERFLDAYQVPLAQREPVVIEALEQRLRANWEGVFCEGVLDRIERRGDRLYVLDFKTGSGQGERYRIHVRALDPEDRSSWARAIGSVQLPLYRRLCALAYGVAPTAVEVRYLFLGQSRLGPHIEDARMGPDPHTACELVEAVLRRIFEELFDPDQPFRPPERLERTCPGCPFQAICGTTWVRASI
ncbi:MAG: PD-(D/E)XK nuclease family protein [Bacteroidetes bacterium]|nr:PD-(D/E)XK nuclease family protein [Rhodothermia bacterium]MCS7155156.1 PD-(D/E)XK nuclease family protein [Bacteroidota bacterium]MCX7906217.1 PD-(D/E)XK nuclease family protein [Bacteroidota bacterium]MDW8138344.1 PD-(D/E)XK nuclease family protein [Bacteroidota bacterium]MDW8286029.1 PD-(D/E)XK nuclease family protein [Bacteroidota bacterium]